MNANGKSLEARHLALVYECSFLENMVHWLLKSFEVLFHVNRNKACRRSANEPQE